MIIPDVNIWVPALREDAVDHGRYRQWLSDAIDGDEIVGISELVASGVLRILTNSRIFRRPSDTKSVLNALNSLRSAPGTQVVRPGERHWDLFVELCRATSAKGNLVADAYHAALALENKATFVTADRGFTAFPDVEVKHPFPRPTA